jgi:low temperature requirement protein LtrA
MLELFFDLVFVFTITELTAVVVHAHGPAGYLSAATILMLVWWIYDGFCWLSNNVGPTTVSTRLPMLVAMALFLVLAMAVPGAYSTHALLFAVTYLLIGIVHGLSFLRSSMGGSARAILAVAPINLSAAGLLFVAAFVDEDWRWVPWWLAVGVLVYSMVRRRETGFAIRAGHFAERHRLLLIIALGESVIAIGVRGQAHLGQRGTLFGVLLAMVLLSALWWVHFTDEERAADALEDLERAHPDRMVRVALMAFSMGYLVLVSGLILVAAGLHLASLDPAATLTWRAALTLGIGTGVYLVGHSFHLWRLGLSTGWVLKVAAGFAVAASVLGASMSGAAEVITLAVVLVVAIVLTARLVPASVSGPESTAPLGP